MPPAASSPPPCSLCKCRALLPVRSHITTIRRRRQKWDYVTKGRGDGGLSEVFCGRTRSEPRCGARAGLGSSRAGSGALWRRGPSSMWCVRHQQFGWPRPRTVGSSTLDALMESSALAAALTRHADFHHRAPKRKPQGTRQPLARLGEPTMRLVISAFCSAVSFAQGGGFGSAGGTGGGDACSSFSACSIQRKSSGRSPRHSRSSGDVPCKSRCRSGQVNPRRRSS